MLLRSRARRHSGGFFDFVNAFTGEDNFPQMLPLRRWWRDFPGGVPWAGTKSFGGVSGSNPLTSIPAASTAIIQGPTLNKLKRKTMTTIIGGDGRIQGGGSLYDVFGTGNDFSGWLLIRTRMVGGSFAQIMGSENGVSGQPYGLWVHSQSDSTVRWIRELGGLSIRVNGGAWTSASTQIDMGGTDGIWALHQFRCQGAPYPSSGVGAKMFRLGGATGSPVSQVVNSSDTDYAEFATVDGILSDAQFNRIRAYARWRYGVSV